MGLAERRAVKDFQETRLPALKQALTQASGLEVPLEIEWSELAREDYSHLYAEAFEKVYFQPLTEALRSITRDDLGREALAEGLKKIVIRNSNGNYSMDAGATFAGGVLTFDHDPVSNIDYWEERRDFLIRMLEKAL